ncbi:S-adenosyl-L-methionine-dependent methyltransferase [Aspergillus californicus]
MASTAVKDLTCMYKSKTFVSRYQLAEKVTGLFAKPLIDQSGIASYQKPLVVFDDACGTGVVTSVLNRTLSAETRQGWKLTCGDFSESMVEYTKQRAIDEGWPNAEAKVVNGIDTNLPSAHYTHIFAAFAIPLFPDVGAAMKECIRILQDGGTLASATWKNVPWIDITGSTVKTISLDLPFPDVDEFLGKLTKGWNTETQVHSVFEQAGFTDIQVSAVTDHISLPISEVVELNLTMIPVILGQWWTKGQREKYEERIPDAMQRYLEGKYGVGGLVPLEPTAIITTARKP